MKDSCRLVDPCENSTVPNMANPKRLQLTAERTMSDCRSTARLFDTFFDTFASKNDLNQYLTLILIL